MKCVILSLFYARCAAHYHKVTQGCEPCAVQSGSTLSGVLLLAFALSFGLVALRAYLRSQLPAPAQHFAAAPVEATGGPKDDDAKDDDAINSKAIVLGGLDAWWAPAEGSGAVSKTEESAKTEA